MQTYRWASHCSHWSLLTHGIWSSTRFWRISESISLSGQLLVEVRYSSLCFGIDLAAAQLPAEVTALSSASSIVNTVCDFCCSLHVYVFLEFTFVRVSKYCLSFFALTWLNLLTKYVLVLRCFFLHFYLWSCRFLFVLSNNKHVNQIGRISRKSFYLSEHEENKPKN